MTKTIAVVTIAAVALGAGCRGLAHQSVRVADTDTADAGSCYRQCQPTRAGGMEAYLGCVKACPGVVVIKGQCKDVEQEPGTTCIEESYTYPHIGGTVVAIVLLSVTAAAISVLAMPDQP